MNIDQVGLGPCSCDLSIIGRVSHRDPHYWQVLLNVHQ